jgi:hypothetical protein
MAVIMSFLLFLMYLKLVQLFSYFFSCKKYNFFQVSVNIFRPNGKHTVVEYPGSIKPAVKVTYNGFDHYYSSIFNSTY